MSSIALLPPIPPNPRISSSIDSSRSTSLLFHRRFPRKYASSDLSRRFDRFPKSRVRAVSGDLGGGAAAVEARKAVIELLMEYGASEEDSLEIASSSPKYVEMLVENVRELDEHSLWGSWSNEKGEPLEEEDVGVLDFERKVYLMAKRKGDGGRLALLESTGVKYSSAMLIARYLASEKLPELINKVKFVKQMLFSSNGQEALIGKNARRMMMHLSIVIDDDIQRTLSFFEKMEARHRGLNMLGYREAFPCLIESFPTLLLHATTDHLNPVIEVFESIGVPKSSIKVIFLLFPPLIFFDLEKDIKARMQALEKAGVKDKDMGRMLLKYPWILSTSIQKNYESVLSFFNNEKVPKSSVHIAIKSWPHILGCSTHKMKSIVEQFADLGVSKKMMTPVITSSPQLLLRKSNEFLKVVALMEEIGLDEKTIGRILSRCPEIFAASVENTLRKKLKFLSDFGIARECLPRVITKYPELLGLDANNTLLPRMRYLMEIGLSKREVCSMVSRFSPLLGYSIEAVLKPKFEFLLNTMQKPLKEIVQYPRYFSYSLEKKIKPRFWILKSRNIDCSLKEMLAKNDEQFAEVYMDIGRMLVVPTVPPDDG